jgi:hypothetical protein
MALAFITPAHRDAKLHALRHLSVLPLALVLLAVVPASARAETVETLRSYWTADRTAILSDVRVVHDDGSTETRQVLGGSVDGIAMIQIPLYSKAPATLAFVPTRNTAAKRLKWGGSCVFITPDSAGSKHIANSDEMTAIEKAVTSWNTGTDACGYLRFVLEPPAALEVGLDGDNTIKFRESTWCRPAHGDEPEKCYDEGATAITTLFFIDKDGRPDDGMILDADIEVNAVDYAIAVGCETRCLTSSTRPIVEDLENTLAHELGHVLGLDHTCWDGSPDRAPVDSDGNPAPACRPISSLSSEVINATMYNFQDPMETKKRTPEQDDLDGVCSNYPKAMDPAVCVPVDIADDGGCCSVAGAKKRRGYDGAALLGGLAFALVVVLRGRACSRTRRP